MNKQLLRILLVAGALCAAPEAMAMQCEMLWSGYYTRPSTWQCYGYPPVSTPVSFWRSPGMGLTWPNQNSNAWVGYAVCEYSYSPDRNVSWHTFYKQNGEWQPYAVDRCYFFCTGQHT